MVFVTRRLGKIVTHGHINGKRILLPLFVIHRSRCGHIDQHRRQLGTLLSELLQASHRRFPAFDTAFGRIDNECVLVAQFVAEAAIKAVFVVDNEDLGLLQPLKQDLLLDEGLDGHVKYLLQM